MAPPDGTPLVAVAGLEAGKTRSVIFFSDSFFFPLFRSEAHKRESVKE